MGTRISKLQPVGGFCAETAGAITLFGATVTGIPVSTTHTIDGYEVKEYRGIVMGEAIIGANIFRDLLAGIRDIVGGRSGTYEEALREARVAAIREMEDEARKYGADAMIGVDIDYETVGQNGSMLMVSASGTAVVLRRA